MLGTIVLKEKERVHFPIHNRCFQASLLARQSEYKIGWDRTFESVRWGLESDHLSDVN